MSKTPKLEGLHLKRYNKLNQKLKEAVRHQNYDLAKEIYADISSLLVPLGKLNRVYKCRNLLFRSAIDTGQLDGVEKGLTIVSERLNKNTKGWLTSHSLLSILYLREGKLEKARQHIEITLRNEVVIESLDRRKKFHAQFIERLEEEALLYTLRGPSRPTLDLQKLINDIQFLFQKNATEAEMEALIADCTPPETRELLLKVDRIVRKHLPYRDEITALPDLFTEKGKSFIGKRIFKALKRRTYVGLCDPQSQVNKLWTEKGIGGLFTGSALGTCIASTFERFEIAYVTMAAPFIGLLLKIGIESVCDSIEEEPDYLS